jgi:hypothetical protein
VKKACKHCVIYNNSSDAETSSSIGGLTITKRIYFRFCVRSVAELREKVIPFFQENPLRTAKQQDFEKFVSVIRMMEEKKHLSIEGIAAIARIVETMNRKKNHPGF